MKKQTTRFMFITLCILLCFSVLFGCVDEGDKTPDDKNVIDPNTCDHEWSEWTLPRDGVCHQSTFTRSCSICKSTEERPGSEEDHDNKQITVESTCLVDGYVMTYCTICGWSEITETLPKGNHSLFLENDGTGHWMECTECKEKVNVQEHSWNDENICIVCGYEAHNHEWTLSLSFPPTCVRNGSETYVCTICGDTKNESLPATGNHTAEGYDFDADTHYQICTICDSKHNTETHSYTDGRCSVCGVYEEYYELSMWVQNGYMAAPLFNEQIKHFADENKITIKLTITEIDSATAGSKIIENPSVAPDIFCYKQTELERLVNVGALMPLSDSAEAEVRDTHSPAAIRCAELGDGLYAFPLALGERTSVMFYDKSLISKEDAKSLEKIIAICEENNRLIRFQMDSGWGVKHFFMALGCESRWSVDPDWNFTLESDNYNSPEGLIALRGMKPLLDSPMLNNETHVYGDDTPTGVIISELSSRWTAQNLFGGTLGVAILPSFTVDGESYRLGAYSDSFLLGAKPTEDAERADVITRLCLWLSGEECQLERFEQFYWCPTNLAAQASDEVQADPYMSAQIEQSHTALPELHGLGNYYYTISALYNDSRGAKNTEELQKALDKYSENLSILIGEE